MRRKIVGVTPKTLVKSGLECQACTQWEGLLEDDVQRRQLAKTENMRRIIKASGSCGKIVYVDNEALAYAQYGPPEFWKGAKRFPSGPISDDAVLLACLYVVPYARGRGLGRVLLQSVEASLIRRKARAIETFAVRSDEHPPGPIEFYLKNGFYILRDNPKYPLLRLDLKMLVGWQTNVQFALDGLKIPNRKPANAPVSSSG